MSTVDTAPLLHDVEEQLEKAAGCCKGACSGFKDFILRGDVVSLAVAVVVGGSFSALVDAFVADWLTPFIGVFFQNSGDFAKASFTINGSVFKYGDFTNVFITFLVNCLVIYFGVVLPLNALVKKVEEPEAPAAPAVKTTRDCTECLSEIPWAAKKCKFCASALKPLPPPPAS